MHCQITVFLLEYEKIDVVFKLKDKEKCLKYCISKVLFDYLKRFSKK